MWVNLMMWAMNGKICYISGTEFYMSLKKMLVILSATKCKMPVYVFLCAQGTAKPVAKWCCRFLWIIYGELFLFVIQMRI